MVHFVSQRSEDQMESIQRETETKKEAKGSAPVEVLVDLLKNAAEEIQTAEQATGNKLLTESVIMIRQ